MRRAAHLLEVGGDDLDARAVRDGRRVGLAAAAGEVALEETLVGLGLEEARRVKGGS